MTFSLSNQRKNKKEVPFLLCLIYCLYFQHHLVICCLWWCSLCQRTVVTAQNWERQFWGPFSGICQGSSLCKIPNTYLNSSKTLKKNWFGKLGTLSMENALLSFLLWRYCHTDHEIPGKEVISQSSLWSYFLTLMIDTSCILDIQRNTWKSEWMNGRVNHSFNKSMYHQSSYIFFNFKITNFLSIVDFQ